MLAMWNDSLNMLLLLLLLEDLLWMRRKLLLLLLRLLLWNNLLRNLLRQYLAWKRLLLVRYFGNRWHCRVLLLLLLLLLLWLWWGLLLNRLRLWQRKKCLLHFRMCSHKRLILFEYF